MIIIIIIIIVRKRLRLRSSQTIYPIPTHIQIIIRIVI